MPAAGVESRSLTSDPRRLPSFRRVYAWSCAVIKPAIPRHFPGVFVTVFVSLTPTHDAATVIPGHFRQRADWNASRWHDGERKRW